MIKATITCSRLNDFSERQRKRVNFLIERFVLVQATNSLETDYFDISEEATATKKGLSLVACGSVALKNREHVTVALGIGWMTRSGFQSSELRAQRSAVEIKTNKKYISPWLRRFDNRLSRKKLLFFPYKRTNWMHFLGNTYLKKY